MMADEEKNIVTNRAAFHEYHILDKFEAGIVLEQQRTLSRFHDLEVKSLRAGHIQVKESYVAVRDDEAWLFNAHISPYTHGNRENHDPVRTRKLLLHRREIERLANDSTVKGMTLVVTRVYLKKGRVKFEIGVARGKKLYDKRETEMRRTVERETRAQLKERAKDN